MSFNDEKAAMAMYGLKQEIRELHQSVKGLIAVIQEQNQLITKLIESNNQEVRGGDQR